MFRSGLRGSHVLAATVVGSLLALTGSALSAGTAEERYKWWQSPSVKAEVGLTDEQSGQLEAVFQSTLPRMKAEKDELDRLEASLSKLLAEATVDEGSLSQQIDKVEAARARASKTRLLMLYRMHRLLAPDQRQRLEVMHQRMKQERRGHGGTRDE
jgi:Spy/CpxP family protein refolding chaperone